MFVRGTILYKIRQLNKYCKNTIYFMEKVFFTKKNIINQNFISITTVDRISKFIYYGFKKSTLFYIIKYITKSVKLIYESKQSKVLSKYIFFCKCICSLNQKMKTIFMNTHNYITYSNKIRGKKGVVLYDHQLECILKFFSMKFAYSFSLLLPCGTGKSLLGVIFLSCINDGQSLCVVTNHLIINQWKSQIIKWTTINPHQVINLPLSKLDFLKHYYNNKGVYICTHRMISFSRIPKGDNLLISSKLFNNSWQMIIFDEMHLLKSFSTLKAFLTLKTNCKIGLSSLRLTEEKFLLMKRRLIGPTIVRYSSKQILKQKNMSLIKYYQVSLIYHPMRKLNNKTSKLPFDQLISKLNILLVRYIKDYFLNMRKSKIIVYCDGNWKIAYLSKALGAPYVDGKTYKKVKQEIIDRFKDNHKSNILVISKIGDSSFDFPGANVIIQFSQDKKINQTTVQRLGRITRPNPVSLNKSYFFDIITSESLLSNEESIQVQEKLGKGVVCKKVKVLININDPKNIIMKFKSV